MAWVPGHWEGERYVEGYWRRSARQGSLWIEGHYDGGGVWVEGRWVDERDVSAYRSGPSAPSAPAPAPSRPQHQTRPPDADPLVEPESLREDDAPPLAQPVEIEESDPDEVHAPPPPR